jgi:hypothetical protein
MSFQVEEVKELVIWWNNQAVFAFQEVCWNYSDTLWLLYLRGSSNRDVNDILPGVWIDQPELFQILF